MLSNSKKDGYTQYKYDRCSPNLTSELLYIMQYVCVNNRPKIKSLFTESELSINCDWIESLKFVN